ncbi:FAD-binding oxidoreductase [Arthrobacter silvisoli]|uniref:FAD-binding oxidoreductase n=1 Tax=Arthrobacter silvisoli TaxID=2291022 RepID=UPI001FE8618A|nr:FAD-binding oxidoreductase [Arthrobacter silvisoli]
MSTMWRIADVVSGVPETETSRTIGLRVAGLDGYLAGQHIDVRLTADDGYSAVRSYSVATARMGGILEITVAELADGEVSPYLVRDLAVGEQLEIRGPVGGWFVWRPSDPNPVQLIAGGSGVVPLMSMVRAHEASANPSQFRLLYSLKSPEAGFYREELRTLGLESSRFSVDYVYTRSVPVGWPNPPARLTAGTLLANILPVDVAPDIFVCGQTVFVETVAEWLVQAGYPAATIKTERFGGTGGTR